MPERTPSTARGGQRGEDPGSRPPLTERIQTRLVDAAREHRANAEGSTRLGRRAPASAKAPRRARLRLTRVDPWSVMKTAFLLSVALGVVTFVAVFVVWSVLGAAGVWDSINSTVASVVEGDDTSSFDVTEYVGMSRVLGFTMLVTVVDVVLLTAIATLMAFLYNLAAALLGGIEVTLAEDDR